MPELKAQPLNARAKTIITTTILLIFLFAIFFSFTLVTKSDCRLPYPQNPCQLFAISSESFYFFCGGTDAAAHNFPKKIVFLLHITSRLLAAV
jgi:hypothetical protein